MSAPDAVLQYKFWDTAVAEYKKKIQVVDWNVIITTSSADEVEKTINTLKQENERRWSTRVFERAHAVCSCFQPFIAVVNTFVSADPTYAALIWGSIQFIMQIIKQSQGVFSKIVEFLEDISIHLPRFQRLWELFPKSSRLEKSLVSVYTDVVFFFAEVISCLGSHPFKTLLKATFLRKEQVLSDMVAQLKKKTELVSEEANTASFEMDKQRYETLERLLRQHNQPSNATISLPCHQIPFPQNPRFVGQQDVLKTISDALSISTRNHTQRAFVLHGSGGMGKSEIALEFSWRHSGEFPVIFWVTAESLEKCFISFLSIAVALGYDRAQLRGNQIGCREIVLGWLNKTTINWLMIFDNAPEDEFDFLRDFLPASNSGSVLITTRNAAFAGRLSIPQSHALEAVDIATASQIMRSVLGHHNIHDYEREIKEICEKLGRLPLALSQMAGFISESACDIPTFLELYRDPANLDELHAIPAAGSTMAYTQTISTVWSFSISSMMTRSPKVMPLLDSLAFLDPDGVPMDLFKQASKSTRLPEEFSCFRNILQFQRSVRDLSTRSLIRVNQQSQRISIHRLLQGSLISQMTKDRRKIFFEGSLALVNHCFPTRTELSQMQTKNMDSIWHQCGLYLPHVLALVKNYDDMRKNLHPSFALASLLDDCTWYLVDYGVYHTALRLFDTARNISEMDPEANLLVRANLYNTYGTLFRNSSRSQEAADLFRHAIDATEKAVSAGLLAADDCTASICYMHMGCALLQLDRFEESEKWHRKAIKIREESSRTRPLELAMVYLNYGWCLWQTGKLDEAVTTLEQALTLMQKEGEAAGSGGYGRSSWVLRALSNVRMEQGRVEDSFNLMSASFKIQIQVWGDTHFETGVMCHKMGFHYYLQRKFEESIKMLRAAVVVYDTTPAQVENLSVRTKHLLSIVLKEDGQLEASDEVKEEVKSLLDIGTDFGVEYDDPIAKWDKIVPYWAR